MDTLLEKDVQSTQEEVEHYDPTKPFDHMALHSDAYYEEYIESFAPNKKKRLFFRFVKRSADIVGALLLLLLALPLFLVIAVAIRLDSKGGVIFKQKRMGRDGKVFWCYKFRSMRVDAPHEVATSLLDDPARHQTRVGRILRKLSLDELPQLWCVLIGTMSFIGYRPLILSEEKCNEMRARLGVFAMRPGISGYAQTHGRDNVYYKNKAVLDAYYVKHANIWMDLSLILHTAIVLVTRTGNQVGRRLKRKKKTQ